MHPAKRGDIFVYELLKSAFYVQEGLKEKVIYALGEVTSVSRDGRVKKYRPFFSGASEAFPKDENAPARLWIINAKVDRDAMRSALKWNTEFSSLDEAREFVQRFVTS